jgi:hypothetical protein
MNAQRDPDAILASWLEEGPNRLPEETRRAISVTTRTNEQERRSPWAPWRTPHMTIFARVAVAAIAVIAVIGGTVYLTGPKQGVGGPQPTPSPSITPAPSSAPPSASPEALASVPIDWTTYTSSRFAYTIDYPTDWTMTPAEVDWPAIDFPDKGGHEHDVFAEFSTAGRLFVSSVPLKAGKTAANWLTELDRWNADHACQLSEPRTITIDGVDARQQEGVCMGTDHLIEVVMANDKRFYQINLFGSSGPFTDRDQGTFDRFLASFRFGA